MNHGLKTQRTRFDTDLPSIIQQHSLGESVRSSNPAFNHPANAPIVEAIVSQIHKKYPSLTVKERQELAEEYFTNFAGQFQKKDQSQQDQQKAQETDWDAFLPSASR